MKLFLILIIAFFIGLFIQDSCSDIYFGDNLVEGFFCGYGKIAKKGLLQTGCDKCPDGTYNRNNDTTGGTCSECGAGSTSNDAKTQCICNSPFINIPGNIDGKKCVCPANKYYDKSTNDCIYCNSNSNIVGSVTRTSKYGGDKTSGSGACVCPKGKYFIKGDTFITPICKKCKAGTYNDTLGLETNCSICPAGKYSSEGSSSCSDCPPGHVSKEGSTSLESCSMCGPGTGPNRSKTACEKCGIGRFSNVNTSGVCKTFDEMNCSANRRFGGNATGLKDCPPVCNASYTYSYISSGESSDLKNETRDFIFKNNMPFIEQPILAYTADDGTAVLNEGECITSRECMPGGNGYSCRDNKCVLTGNYDHIQDIYYKNRKQINNLSHWWHDKKQRPTNIYCEDLSPVYSLYKYNHCSINDKDFSPWLNPKKHDCECPPYTKKVYHRSNGNKLFRCEPIPNLPKPTPSPVK